MDRDENGHDGLNGQEWTAEWTMDDGQWTMNRDYVAPFRANPNIADPTDPTDLLDPSDPTDLSEKATDQITNSRAIPSGKATTPQIFRAFRAFRGQKNGLRAISPRQVFSCGS